MEEKYNGVMQNLMLQLLILCRLMLYLFNFIICEMWVDWKKGRGFSSRNKFTPAAQWISLGSDVGAVEGDVMSLFGTSVTVDLAGVGAEWNCTA
jgi:hypothetical protein